MTDAVYEMFWDCRYCGQKKLLGLTHRFCAKCGAPQDPNARYFPPEDEKVAVHDHVFVGADVTCPACRHPMSRAATCCTNCGSPLTRGTEVQLRDPNAPPAPRAFHAPPPVAPTSSRPSKTKMVVGIVVALVSTLVVFLLVAVLWKKEASVVVSGHTWVRSIDVQTYGPVRKSDWCDSLPFGARELSRHREQRSTKQIRDGETCTTRKKDNGDGTYREVRECSPKYRSEPVYADRCDYEINEWRTTRTATERGSSVEDRPRWPVVTLARSGTCIGCEREGARSETYTVLVEDTKEKKTTECTYPEAKWASLANGTRRKAKVYVMTGKVDCSEL